MATKIEPGSPSSPMNDETDGEDHESVDEQETCPPEENNVDSILKRLQSSGAFIKKAKQEFNCHTCSKDFSDWEELENHLIQHVSLPSILLNKLPSDEEDYPSEGDENWSEDEGTAADTVPQNKTPQKIDISQILNKPGLCIKKPGNTNANSSDSALSKLSGLGFTIKKSTTPVKQEKPDSDQQSSNDLMQKLGKLGGLKLKLKSDGNSSNSFKVINGLQDFRTSDNEDEASGDEESRVNEESEEEKDTEASNENKISSKSQTPVDHRSSESDDSDSSSLKKIKTTKISQKISELAVPSQKNESVIPFPKKVPSRPNIKQTPKRGANLPLPPKPISQPSSESTVSEKNSSPELKEHAQPKERSLENVVVKQEIDTSVDTSTNPPLFSSQIKEERRSPTAFHEMSSPALATVKSEPDPTPTSNAQPLFNSNSSTTPLLPVTKTEDSGVTVIEINGDSNDEDDDCCVVSATPAPDVKPVIPKTEPAPVQTSLYSIPPPYSSQPSYSHSNTSSTQYSTGPFTEKNHNFNWNAPDTKPSINLFDKSPDDILESLLSSKKESHSSLADASEFISLDALGPKQSCEVCNLRFTDISLLEEHRRTSGHSNSLAMPSSSVMPYNSSSGSIISSLFPVKQLAEQVGKLVPSGMGNSGPGFTHQQNVMINIQAYPGAGGMAPPAYNSYPGQNMHQGYTQPPNNMYPTPQSAPSQYPNQNYMGQQGYGQQYQQPMSQSNYPTPYSNSSPLHSMQQAVYGQTPGNVGQMNTPGHMGPPASQIGGQMGPPGSSYVPSSSPGNSMRAQSGSGIKIQNVQAFPPGASQYGQSGKMSPSQTPGQGPAVGGQINTSNQIRMAPGANTSSLRVGMQPMRPVRPKNAVRPGMQVHGQIQGSKSVRMPMKRPGVGMGGPGQKRRPDMLLPGKHDNEDCQVMAMQKQRDGMPMIQSVQGAKDKLKIGNQISITKKTVNKEANAMATVLASRGISVKQKQKSRSPTPERPLPHIPNLGSGVSIKHSSKSSNFSIPEARVGNSMLSCKICKKMFMNQNSLQVHMANAHPQTKIPLFKCDECPASYPKSLQLQHHKRVFHNVSGPNRELGLPVVDMADDQNLKRLSNLGIYSYIPLASREQAGGSFGIPIISVHNMMNGVTNSLKALGADGLLSLGPMKPLPNT